MLATTGGSFLNFLYHFVIGRMLGPADYAALVALISVFATVTAPMGVSQTLLADVTARLLVLGGAGEIRHLLQRIAGGLAVLAVLVVGGMALASGQLSQFMHLLSPVPVVVLALAVGPALLLPALTGVLQGWQDFRGMSLAGLLGSAARLAAGVGFVWLGFGVSGAMAGFVAAGLAPAGLALFLLGRRLNVPPQPAAITREELMRFSLQVALASLGFAALTNADVVFARRFFAPEQAGYYSAAATLGKIVLFLPGPVAMLMFPKSSARHAAGESRGSMIRKSALGTLGLSLAVVGVLAIWPAGIVKLLFGADFAQAGQWVGLYGVAMTGTALVNLFMAHYLAAHDHRFVLVLLGFVAAQLVCLTLLPHTPLVYILVVAGSSWGALLAAEAWLGGLREHSSR